MSFSTTIYNAVCKRTSTFVFAVITSAFVFERTFDLATESLYEHLNKGKLWKDIKHKYEKPAE